MKPKADKGFKRLGCVAAVVVAILYSVLIAVSDLENGGTFLFFCAIVFSQYWTVRAFGWIAVNRSKGSMLRARGASIARVLAVIAFVFQLVWIVFRVIKKGADFEIVMFLLMTWHALAFAVVSLIVPTVLIIEWVQEGFGVTNANTNRARSKSAHRERVESASEQERSRHCSALGVGVDASQEEIRKAYRAKVAQYHPDKVAGLGPEIRLLAEEKTKIINNAYKYLTQDVAR